MHTLKTLRIRFSFLLPLIELAIWLIVVLVPATLGYFALRSYPHHGNQVMIANMTMPYKTARRIALEGPALRASHLISALNMPAFFVDVLISLPTSWPDTWKPDGMVLDVWRTFAFPFFALPAWWFAGRGIDSLLFGRKPGKTVTIISAVLCIGFTVLFCGLRFALTPADREGETWPLWGLALWTALFAAFPAAWLRSRRFRTEPLEAIAETES